MRLGFLTNSLGHWSLEKLTSWALENDFRALKVGPSIPLEENSFLKAQEQIEIAALIYCRNFLSPDQAEANEFTTNLHQRIDFASKVGIPHVITSTGIDPVLGVAGSLDTCVAFLSEVVELAARKQVKILLENCPLMGNIAISPYMWHHLFDQIKSDNIGLAYDPSHLIWQFVDPYQAILDFRDKIFHVHAKDTEVFPEVLQRTGFSTNNSWWRYRIPGWGQIDWTKIVSRLMEIDYQGTISIEHEDPVWEGSEEKIKAGLIIGRTNLQRVLGRN